MHRTTVTRPVMVRDTLVVTLCAAALLLAAALPGCGYYATGTHERYESGDPRLVDDQVSYTARNVAVADDTLAVRLERECVQTREVDVQTIEVTERQYRTWWMWSTAGTIVFFGGFFAMFAGLAADEGEDSAALETGLTTLGLALAVSGVALYFELADHDVEHVVGTRTDRETRTTECATPWPSGTVTLMSAAANQSFEGTAHGDGRVTVPLGGANRKLWLSTEPVQLALPDDLDWVDVELPSAVRTAMIDDSDGSAERVYVWYEVEEQYKDLLKAGTERVQGSMTNSRRYQFLADTSTRAQIEKAVARGGGSAEARRQNALEAAQAENIKKVVQLSITPVFETQVQLSFAVYDTATGDQIYTTHAPADLAQAITALTTFEQLADAFLAWEKQ